MYYVAVTATVTSVTRVRGRSRAACLHAHDARGCGPRRRQHDGAGKPRGWQRVTCGAPGCGRCDIAHDISEWKVECPSRRLPNGACARTATCLRALRVPAAAITSFSPSNSHGWRPSPRRDSRPATSARQQLTITSAAEMQPDAGPRARSVLQAMWGEGPGVRKPRWTPGAAVQGVQATLSALSRG